MSARNEKLPDNPWRYAAISMRHDLFFPSLFLFQESAKSQFHPLCISLTGDSVILRGNPSRNWREIAWAYKQKIYSSDATFEARCALSNFTSKMSYSRAKCHTTTKVGQKETVNTKAFLMQMMHAGYPFEFPASVSFYAPEGKSSPCTLFVWSAISCQCQRRSS